MTDRCLDRLRDENSLIWPMFGHVPGIEQGFILQRYGQRLHVPADAGEQREAAAQQVFRQLLADIALVAEQLAGQLTGQRWDRRGVMDIAGGQLQGDDFIVGVEDEVQLEAEEPAHRGLAALGQTGKDLVPANAMIIADRQGGEVDVVEPGPGPQVTDEEEHQRHEGTFLQGDEVLDSRACRERSNVYVALSGHGLLVAGPRAHVPCTEPVRSLKPRPQPRHRSFS